MGLIAQKAANSPEPIFTRVAKAAAANLYTPQTTTNIKSNGNIVKKLGIGLTETPGKVVAYGSFALAIGTTVRNFIKFDEITNDLLDNVKRWAIPIVSFAVSMLSTYFNYKGQKILEKGLIDLNNKDDQKQIFNKSFEKIFNYLRKHPEFQNQEEGFNMNDFFESCKSVLSEIDLGYTYDQDYNNDWFETANGQHLAISNKKCGLKISTFDEDKRFKDKALTPDTRLKFEFYIVKDKNKDKTIKSINLTFRELLSNGWLERAPKWFTDKISLYLLTVERDKEEKYNGPPRLFAPSIEIISPKIVQEQPLVDNKATKSRKAGGGDNSA